VYDVFMAAKKKAATRGGRRKGAGRKPVLKSPVRITAHVEESVVAELQDEAGGKGVSVGELLRTILAAHLKRRRK
jgi:hypothetical protein